MKRYISGFLLGVFLAVTLVFAEAGLIDRVIASERNRQNMKIGVIVAVIIGGSIIFASYNIKKRG